MRQFVHLRSGYATLFVDWRRLGTFALELLKKALLDLMGLCLTLQNDNTV